LIEKKKNNKTDTFLSVDEYQLKLDYFHSLIEASKSINSTLDLYELLEIILNIAVKETHAKAGTIYLKDNKTNEIWSKLSASDKKVEIRLSLGQGIAGQVGQTGETINIINSGFHPKFENYYDKETGFGTKSMLCMPMKNIKDQIVGVFQIMNSSHGEFSNVDEEFLSGLSVHAAIALEKADLYKKALEKEALEHEMAIAQTIQQGLLPKVIPQINGYTIVFPAKAIGGDYFDFIFTKQNVIRFCVADVCGKGVPAALLMATLRTAVHVFDTNNTIESIKDFAAKLNAFIYESTPSNSFITFFYGELNVLTGTMLYFNAGHIHPVLLDENSKIKEFVTHDIALGLVERYNFRVLSTNLNHGDIFFVFSDGIVEAMNETNQEFGETNILKSFKEIAKLKNTDLINALINKVKAFTGLASQSDDMTIIYLERN
jgi:phosphoserine phosphatase RsbU/P